MPSGGVEGTREDVFAWIKADAAALNIGGKLIDKDLVKVGDFEGISRKVEQCIGWIKEARGTPLFVGVEHVAIYPTDEAKAEEVAAWYKKTFDFARPVHSITLAPIRFRCSSVSTGKAKASWY
jgi:hypothetical protein